MTGPLDPYPSSATEPEPAPRPTHDYASWGARAGALSLDTLLLTVPLVLAIVFFVAASAAEDEQRSAGSLWVIGGLMILLYFLVPFVYFAVLNGNERGQTLGKRVARIRTRRRDGTALGIGRALGRYALTFAIGFVVGPLIIVDYLWPLWDAENQTLHDKAVDSVVVKA